MLDSDWFKRALGTILLALPAIVAAAFVWLNGSRFPIADEWAFTKAVMAIQEIRTGGLEGIRQSMAAMRVTFHGHWVIVPFTIYWALADLVRFNSLAFTGITLAALAVQLLVFRWAVVPSALLALPVALVLFSPARYVDLIWGFQFTLALSCTLPMVGLAILSTISKADSSYRQVRKALAAVCLISLGTLSANPGFFGLPAAAVLMGLQPIGRRARLLGVSAFSLLTLLFYVFVMQGAPTQPLGARSILQFLTHLGGTIWATPVSQREFGIDRTSLTGLALLVALSVSVVVAIRQGRLAAIALPASFVVFGLLSAAAISVARPHLGNWHLQAALPAVCGAYGCAYRALPGRRKSIAAWTSFAILYLLLCLAAVGTYRGFTDHGPKYRGYVQVVENYALRFLAEPDLVKTYPGGGGGDLTPELALFLMAHERFATVSREPRDTLRPVARAMLFVHGRILQSRSIAGPNPHRMWITAALPKRLEDRRVVLQIGDITLPLNALHARHSELPVCGRRPCYSAMLLPNRLAEGQHAIAVWVAPGPDRRE